jgi:hypothetical protein
MLPSTETVHRANIGNNFKNELFYTIDLKAVSTRFVWVASRIINYIGMYGCGGLEPDDNNCICNDGGLQHEG